MVRGLLFGHAGWGCDGSPAREVDPREGDQQVVPERGETARAAVAASQG